MEDINVTIQSLGEGGVTDLVYQAFHDDATGEIRYMDRQGNIVTQA
jgi:hypothetical protein